MKQYSYKHWLQTFKISTEAGELLINESDLVGRIQIHREHIPENEAPKLEEWDDDRDHYATDEIYQHPEGGDIVRVRISMVDDDPVYELIAGNRGRERMITAVYRNEWEYQETDDNQYYWFEWVLETDNHLPDVLLQELPKRFERNADPSNID